jgi:hypothetical protein
MRYTICVCGCLDSTAIFLLHRTEEKWTVVMCVGLLVFERVAKYIVDAAARHGKAAVFLHEDEQTYYQEKFD